MPEWCERACSLRSNNCNASLQGKETYPSGDVYQGEWLNDLKDGQGVLKYADGHIYDGTWKMVLACSAVSACLSLISQRALFRDTCMVKASKNSPTRASSRGQPPVARGLMLP